MEEKLKSEVVGLVRYVERLRQEIANIAQGRNSENTNFQNMSTQLDAIVMSTEEASNAIMAASEIILEASNRLEGDISDDDRKSAQVDIAHSATAVMEACSFQDLAGQRVTKILHSLRFVEERVESMIELCGSDAMVELIGELPEPEPDHDDVEMHGPTSEGISQDEIDALFD